MTTDKLKLAFYKAAASGLLPARWFEPDLPPLQARAAKTGRLHLEVVSHCWRYSHFLIYQLSSLVLFPPQDMDVTMTVFYCPEDTETESLLRFFAEQQVQGVHWNWQPLPRQQLFRRSIGRNRAALATTADWVWFTDCDLMFRENCLDTLSRRLQGRQDALFYPDEERCSDLLEAENPMLGSGRHIPAVLDIDDAIFTSQFPTRATGPLQIAHGDVCRAVGYCRNIGIYQKPVERFAKCHEDRAFRWLLGTRGTPLAVPGVYRIRHIQKGRYSGSETHNQLRTRIRALQSRRRDRRGAS
ncbi:glycosyltransferase family 2 protein [Alcanivorax sp. JB21]|uniref:glycosyltransferase family A protein n=1 Tax=Alcanivorax limicola TaxID=2874102 RepID=UPI001CBBC4C2|nr:glycosyltransferase family A protein [Alcanivorax limicola]MBZ2188706.1 glycosyltransferase family 2 protein [Alcanivorax limicola]